MKKRILCYIFNHSIFPPTDTKWQVMLLKSWENFLWGSILFLQYYILNWILYMQGKVFPFLVWLNGIGFCIDEFPCVLKPTNFRLTPRKIDYFFMYVGVPFGLHAMERRCIAVHYPVRNFGGDVSKIFIKKIMQDLPRSYMYPTWWMSYFSWKIVPTRSYTFFSHF